MLGLTIVVMLQHTFMVHFKIYVFSKFRSSMVVICSFIVRLIFPRVANWLPHLYVVNHPGKTHIVLCSHEFCHKHALHTLSQTRWEWRVGTNTELNFGELIERTWGGHFQIYTFKVMLPQLSHTSLEHVRGRVLRRPGGLGTSNLHRPSLVRHLGDGLWFGSTRGMFSSWSITAISNTLPRLGQYFAWMVHPIIFVCWCPGWVGWVLSFVRTYNIVCKQ